MAIGEKRHSSGLSVGEASLYAKNEDEWVEEIVIAAYRIDGDLNGQAEWS